MQALRVPRRTLLLFSSFMFLSCVSCINRTGFSLNKGLASAKLEDPELRRGLKQLRDAVVKISPQLGITISTLPKKCIQIQCRFICFNGWQTEITDDINNAMRYSEQNTTCDYIDELQLYNYYFPNATMPVGFLGYYGNKIKIIHICVSNVTTIEPGAFGGGVFKRILLEDLRLVSLDKEFFRNISRSFTSLSIVQRDLPMISVCTDFLEYVKFQIEYLVIQVGLQCVRNVTDSDSVLSTLSYVDLRYNDFRNSLRDNSFSKLTMIERLSLARSNIELLPDYIFNKMQYLEFLDISHNNLITLSHNIFGVDGAPHSLRLDAYSNPWHCDCQLQQEMNAIFTQSTSQLICVTPLKYANWSVFDERLCDHSMESEDTTVLVTYTTTDFTTTSTTFGTSTQTSYTSTSTTTSTTTSTPEPPTTEPINYETDSLGCTGDNTQQNIRLPLLEFYPTSYGALTVKITLESKYEGATFGLFWFSMTTKEYHIMQMVPDHYGIGCHFPIPAETVVKNLVPNIAYTFCLVESQETTLSPFSCKSIHVDGNVESYYYSRTSVSMRGISLMVLGVVLFMFCGIAFVYLVLKKKPIWLKGSKRVTKPKNSSGEIVVLPRANTKDQLKRREAMLSRSKQHRSFPCISRRNSVESYGSDSYMNDNIYEVIPAYLTFDEVRQPDTSTSVHFPYYDKYVIDSASSLNGALDYMEIAPRTKRTSSDPLPAVPLEKAPFPLQAPGLSRVSDASADYIVTINSSGLSVITDVTL